MDPLTLLTVFAPVVMDGAKALIGKWTDNKPAITSAEDYLKIQDADIRKLEAIAKLDAPSGETYKWVSAIRSMQRPVVVMVVLLVWVFAIFFVTDAERLNLVSNLASAVFFYLFGERGLGYIKAKK